MTGPGQRTARIRLYKSDPLLAFAERTSGEYDDYYEIPADLMDAYEAAEKARETAVGAIGAYIRDNNIRKVDPFEEQP